jgi:hypothetical protein
MQLVDRVTRVRVQSRRLRSKKLLILAALAAAALAVPATGSTASASPSTRDCAYEMRNVDIVVDLAGADATPSVCRAVFRGSTQRAGTATVQARSTPVGIRTSTTTSS